MSMKKPTEKAKTARYQSIFEADNGLERLILFSDAVFAIAITLLALEIRLPAAADELSNQALLQMLLALGPKYIGYIISFLVIGNFWIWHHARFRSIVRYDNRLFVLNLFLLMTVAFIPFPTAVISENGNRTATVFYALSITATGLCALALWSYAAYRQRLTRPLELREARRGMANTLIVPLVFLISIGIAYLDPDLAKYFWVFTALAAINAR